MPHKLTRGLDELGHALRVVARSPGQSVADFARACGLPRSSAFALVRRLENELIVERDAAGLLWPGLGAAGLGFGALGLGGIEGAADALLGSLREELNATAQLRAGETALVSRCAEWDRKGGSPAGAVVEAPVAGGRAVIRLSLRSDAGTAEIEEAQACADRVAVALTEQFEATCRP